MHVMGSAPGARAIIDDREVDYFCGTSYLGLQGSSELADAVNESTATYGLGSATSRMSFGNNPAVLAVEEQANLYFDTEACAYFASGYLGSAILLQGLTERYDVIFIDAESHFAAWDAVAMARKPTHAFNSRDPEDLAQKLAEVMSAGQRPLLISDGIYPGDGVVAPLQDYAKILADYDDAILCVDDAHGSGVIGLEGRGTLEYCELELPHCFSVGTLSKAFGGFGGLIADSSELVDQLYRHAKVLVGSSPPPVPAAAASARALTIARTRPELRHTLWENVRHTKTALREVGFEGIPDTPVPIVSLSPTGVDLESLQASLAARDILTLYLPPGAYTSVPATGSLRISLFADHTKQQIDRLVQAIAELV